MSFVTAKLQQLQKTALAKTPFVLVKMKVSLLFCFNHPVFYDNSISAQLERELSKARESLLTDGLHELNIKLVGTTDF